MEMSSRSTLKNEVIVRRNPGDLTVIEFLDAGITHIARADWHKAYIRPEDRPRVEGRTFEEFRLARVLRAKNSELADRDPDWDETHKMAEDMQDYAAASPRLTNRVRAEGERERILKQNEHRFKRESDTAAGVDEGDDLQARLEAMDPPVSEPEVPPVADQDADEALDALRQGRRRSRTRTRQED